MQTATFFSGEDPFWKYCSGAKAISLFLDAAKQGSFPIFNKKGDVKLGIFGVGSDPIRYFRGGMNEASMRNLLAFVNAYKDARSAPYFTLSRLRGRRKVAALIAGGIKEFSEIQAWCRKLEFRHLLAALELAHEGSCSFREALALAQ